MLASFPKVPVTYERRIFDYLTVVWRPLSREPPGISA